MKSFQENVRKLTITGFDKKEPLFYKGWSSIIAMKMLHPQYKNSLSEEQNNLILRATSEIDNFDINKNVRGIVKEVLMYPIWPNFPPWKEYHNDEIKSACAELSNKPHVFKVVDGKLYLMLPTFSDKLNTIVDNDEEPHLTIINSNKFVPEEHNEYHGVIIDDVIYSDLAFTESLDYAPFKEVIVVKAYSQFVHENLLKKELHYTIRRINRESYRF